MSDPLRVLIVEDSESDTLLLLRELEKNGFDPTHRRVETAPGLTSALADEPWDIVLSDYRMPRFTGLDALEIVQGKASDLPFIIISGTIGEDVAVEAMKMGVHDYLMKGKLKRLGPAIRRELQEARVRREHRAGVEKVQHLNRVLRAIRNIDQLIVRERDPRQLIEQACRNLVETRGYQAAWIAVFDHGRDSVLSAEVGFGEVFVQLLEQLEAGKLPGCSEAALTGPDVVVTTDPRPTCSGCPLKDLTGDHESLTVRLESEGKVYGLMSVNLSSPLVRDEPEASLFSELASDIAFALRYLEAEEQRKAAEEAVRTSEENLRKIFNESTDGILLADPETKKFHMGNRTILRMTGHTREEIRGLGVTDIHPEKDLPGALEAFERHARREISLVEDMPVKRKDGSVFYADINTTPVVLQGRTYLMGAFRDTTERRQMRAQIAQSDRLASMGMLAAGVAHEINNPLTYVLYNLESLTNDLPDLAAALRGCFDVMGRLGEGEWESLMGAHGERLNPAVVEDIQTRSEDALLGARRIKDIVRDLGTFSRVEDERLVPVDLMHAVEAAINMVSNELKYRSRLVREYGKISPVLASDGRLSQVFLNLLVNAAHAIEEGDVEGNEIRVRTWQEGDEVLAEVQDTGKGIAAEHIPRLFEPFFTTKEVGFGTGLGLHISKNIIEDYGGRLTVASELGKGTRFVVRLPARQKAESPETEYRGASTEKVVRGRILLIDDDDTIRAAMVRMLREHEVVEAVSGEAGRRILQDDQLFDVIICDLMMPDMSGVELHQWLVETYPRLVEQVVFITGGAFTPRAQEYIEKVDNIRLEKPFEVADFKKIVNDRIQLAKSA